MPSRKNIGTKTMQMHKSETKAGVTICWAPSMIAASTSLPCSKCQLMFSIVTVASSTSMPTASASAARRRDPAERHDVEGLADRRERDDRAENGQRDRYGDDHGRAPAA